MVKQAIKPKNVILNTTLNKVKFESTRNLPNVSSNRGLPPVGLNLSKTSISVNRRPILKAQHEYFSSPSSEISEASVASHNSSSSNNIDSIHYQSTATLKLPPIVACSDDFYAVLKELENENLYYRND